MRQKTQKGHPEMQNAHDFQAKENSHNALRMVRLSRAFIYYSGQSSQRRLQTKGAKPDNRHEDPEAYHSF